MHPLRFWISCLALLGILVVSAHAQSRPKRGGGIGENGPKPGTQAPDFTLKTVDGKSVQASALWSKKPLVIMTASHTCPVFRGKSDDFQSIASEFKDRASFLIIYTIEAHPKGDPSPYSGKEWTTPANEREGILFRQPVDFAERLQRAQACVEREKLRLPVVVDAMENKVWKAYGSAPNCAYVIGTDGKIVESQPWMDANRLRQTLRDLPTK